MDKRKNNVVHKKKSDGTENHNYIDLLDEDKPIAGQEFACVSFISPEHIIQQKNEFMLQEFLKGWDLRKSVEKFTQFLNFISYKYTLNFDDVMKDMSEFVKEEQTKLSDYSLTDDYKTFYDKHEHELDKKFNKLHNFQTSVRGIKIRGTFPSQNEAEFRCKMLREIDPNHDVYVAPVGLWLPFHPESYKTGRVEYLESELNQLMAEKKKNEENAKDAFDKRVKDAKYKAIEENVRIARENNNKLSQTIDNNGNLIGIQNMNTQERTLLENRTDDNVSTDAIVKELFEGENIVTTKTDHGLSLMNVDKN